MTDEVAVVGGGAVGLTLAGRLAQLGVDVAVYEAEPRHERIGRLRLERARGAHSARGAP